MHVDKAAKIEAAAMKEGIREMGPFWRELMEWAFEHSEDETSLFLLKRAGVKIPQLERNGRRGKSAHLYKGVGETSRSARLPIY